MRKWRFTYVAKTVQAYLLFGRGTKQQTKQKQTSKTATCRHLLYLWVLRLCAKVLWRLQIFVDSMTPLSGFIAALKGSLH